MTNSEVSDPQSSRVVKVVVATTVMLSFISFWRAAAIVLSDLASSAYYAGGIAETAIGKSAPWFILSIMLFSYAVRAIYIESCSMFVRGGVYKVVHEAMGGTLAKFSVSALMFDYVLTGPISAGSAGMEEFQLKQSEEVSIETVPARPGNVLVPVHNPYRLRHLEKTLIGTDTSKEDVVVLSVHLASPAGSGEHDLRKDQIFGPRETEVFSKVVSVAEKAGKHVALLAVAGTNPLVAIVQTAIKLKSARIVLNHSPQFRNAGDQARAVEKQWERLPAPRFPLALEIVLEDSTKSQFHIFGQHPTRLWPEDFERIHKLWLEISEKEPGAEIRHRDVVSVALCRLDKDFHSDQGSEILNEIHREAVEQKHGLQSGSEPSED